MSFLGAVYCSKTFRYIFVTKMFNYLVYDPHQDKIFKFEPDFFYYTYEINTNFNCFITLKAQMKELINTHRYILNIDRDLYAIIMQHRHNYNMDIILKG